MSQRIFLPELKHIIIENYSLYNKNIEYTFIEGINLIIGGNGVGKTTFINIIKYALIGLYKKDLTVRNYQGEKRLNRGTYSNCNTYFRNRTQNTLDDQKAKVTLKFKINDYEFEVTRSLYDTKLLKAHYIKDGEIVPIKGKAIKQEEYSKYENDDEETKIQFLQYNYEQIVAQKANMTDFNDFIFFVNQILMFGEDRSNVLWDVDTQSRLLSNYLNDRKLEAERKNYKMEEKYQDSIARHKQEEIKAIRKVVEQVSNDKEPADDEHEIEKLISLIEKSESYLSEINKQRKLIQNEIQLLHKNIADISVKINELENEKTKIESTSYFWINVNPKYTIFKQQFERNNICPMCNSALSSDITKAKDDECFFCHNQISRINDNRLLVIEDKLKTILIKRQNYEMQLLNYETDIDNLDKNVRSQRLELFTLKTKLRDLESVSDKDMGKDTAYVAMLKRIDDLTLEKEDAQKKCEQCKLKGNDIIQQIEKNLIESTRSISDIFKQFAEAFLQLPCYLSLDNNIEKKIKIFIPVIDGKRRVDAEELSESQRFFIDYSFRMSILAYFYNGSSFYICETPDSSLDLSYEENAADTLIKYVERPNSLIITSNLNNSIFIKHLLKKSKKISILNLLKYGKISKVQINHQALQNLSKEIEEMANEKL